MKLMWNAFVLLCLALFGSSMAASTDWWMSDNDIATAACRMADMYNRVRFVRNTLYDIHDGIYKESKDLIFDANRLDAVDPNSAASAQKAAAAAKQAVDECNWGLTNSYTHLKNYMETLKKDLPELKANGHDHFEQV
ncbi:hypothetical protein ERJ75_000165000 [Trypanosoma vivax]|nr:hypothetical protein ERJ75_000165000 [Trypanosoma vivax]